MILEALGILKILDWATAGDRYQPPARFVEPPDKKGPPYAVEGGEIRIVTKWWGEQKQYYLEGRLAGTKKWKGMCWFWDGRMMTCIPAFTMNQEEFQNVFSKVLHDPDVLKCLKEAP